MHNSCQKRNMQPKKLEKDIKMKRNNVLRKILNYTEEM